jgi:hypothetical protein
LFWGLSPFSKGLIFQKGLFFKRAILKALFVIILLLFMDISNKKRGRKTNILAEKELADERKTNGGAMQPTKLMESMDNIIHLKIKPFDVKYLEWKLENKYITEKAYNKFMTKNNKNKNKNSTIVCTDNNKNNGYMSGSNNETINGSNNNGSNNGSNNNETNNGSNNNGSNNNGSNNNGSNNNGSNNGSNNNGTIAGYMNGHKGVRMPINVNANILVTGNTFGSNKIYEVIDIMYDEKWVTGQKKKCKFCTLSFVHNPWVLIYDIQVHNKTKVSLPIARNCFCTANCCVAQINKEGGNSKNQNIEYVYYLYKLIYGKNYIGNIVPTPDIDLMIDYGGTCTKKEFQELIGENAIYMVDYPHIACVGSRINRIKTFEGHR